MRVRLLPLIGSAALAISLFAAVPASAAHTVAIAFPGGNSEFYSPFGGPATITVTIDTSDVSDAFTARLRPTGGTAIASKEFWVDKKATTKVVSFSWSALSVTTARQYDVAVFRHGAQVAVESFYLHPKLVRITDIAPDPFFPKIDDGYKDVTHVRFTLAADADAEARVFGATAGGRCCTARVLTAPLGPRTAGANTWAWDGRGGDGLDLRKGDYIVRIHADDGVLSPATSSPWKVSIARTYRAKATRSKPAIKYHHVGPITPIVLGGSCVIDQDGGLLRVLCQGGDVSVFWRWGLGPGERIVDAGFVVTDPGPNCSRRIRRVGHTKHESSFTMHEDVDGRMGLCHLETAKITYSYPKAS